MRQGLADLLNGSGYQAEILPLPSAETTNLANLIDEIVATNSDLILLDINLSGINGELLLKSLRAKSNVPVIMITSSNLEMDEVLSMSYGADDYITKPYNPQILLLRIAAVLKRIEGNSDPIKFHDLTIDLNRGVIEGAEKRVLLTKNEMVILRNLLSHQGNIVTRDDLMTDLWNNHEYINDNALTVNVSRLRSKFKSLHHPDAIETRKGLGYIIQ